MTAAEVRLLVAAAGEQVLEGLSEAAADWAAENAFEFVPQPSSASSEEAAALGEKEGLERVREALHSHSWPGLEPKSRAAPAGRANAEAAAPGEHAPAGEADIAADGDALEELLAEMMTARDEAAVGGQTDEERRARAAALASKMAALLGLEGGEEEDEEEQEEEEEEV